MDDLWAGRPQFESPIFGPKCGGQKFPSKKRRLRRSEVVNSAPDDLVSKSRNGPKCAPASRFNIFPSKPKSPSRLWAKTMVKRVKCEISAFRQKSQNRPIYEQMASNFSPPAGQRGVKTLLKTDDGGDGKHSPPNKLSLEHRNLSTKRTCAVYKH